MEFRVLKYFLAVAREENITRAAQLLHLTQPTLSRQLMQLEEELGVTLFLRSRHKIILTGDGLLLKRRAEELISLMEKTRQDFAHKGEALAGEIAIGCGEFKSSHLLGAMIASFRQTYPLVQFKLFSAASDLTKERIEGGLLDLGLLSEPVDISKYHFLRMPLREKWGILTPDDSPLAKLSAVTAKDLYRTPLIMTQREMMRNELLHWFGKYADKLNIAASGNLTYNMAMMAKNHVGTVITLELDASYDGLTFVPLFPAMETGSVLVWKKTETLSPATSAFILHLKKQISEMSADL